MLGLQLSDIGALRQRCSRVATDTLCLLHTYATHTSASLSMGLLSRAWRLSQCFSCFCADQTVSAVVHWVATPNLSPTSDGTKKSEITEARVRVGASLKHNRFLRGVLDVTASVAATRLSGAGAHTSGPGRLSGKVCNLLLFGTSTRWRCDRRWTRGVACGRAEPWRQARRKVGETI
jgi:hypothetical protein